MARHERRVGYGLPTLLAIGVHVLVLLMTIVRWPESEPTPSSSSVVQATLVSTETTTDQAQRVEDAQASAAARQAEEAEREEQEAREAEQAQQAEAEAQTARENERQARVQAQQQAEAEAERRAEEAAQQAQLREQQAEQQRQEEAERQAEEAVEQQRQEEEAQQQAEEEAAEQQRQEEEAQQQAEEEAAEQQRQEEEAHQQAEEEAAEQQRREEEARARAEAAQRAAESSLDNLIAGEAESIANARQASEASNSFINLVRSAVEQAWILPSSAGNELRTIVRIQLLPTGELINASISQSSGDATFDRSVLRAVERAAPFTEMSELPAAARSQFREFNLDFNPEDVRR